MVEIGVVLPSQVAAGEALPDVAAAARIAEEVGLDAVWTGDHLAIGQAPLLDAPMVLSAAAAVTSRVGLGFAVLLPSLRPLVWAAKQVVTLQQLAGPGRVRLGVGVGGGPPQEWQAAGFRRTDRGARTDEFLALLPSLLAGLPTSVPSAPGSPSVTLTPAVPVPPVWVGGSSSAALGRTIRYADGWLGGLQTAAETAATVRRLTELAGAAGRAAPAIGVVLQVAVDERGGPGLREGAAQAVHSAYGVPMERARQLVLAGTPAAVTEQLGGFVQAGVSTFALLVGPSRWRRSCELLAEVRGLGSAPAPGRQ